MTAAHDANLFTSDSAGGPHDDGLSDEFVRNNINPIVGYLYSSGRGVEMCGLPAESDWQYLREGTERIKALLRQYVAKAEAAKVVRPAPVESIIGEMPATGIVPPDRKAAEDPGTVDFPVCHKVRARALERENAELRKELADYKELWSRAIYNVDRVFQVDAMQDPPLLPDFLPLGADKFEGVVELAKAYICLRDRIKERNAENAELKAATFPSPLYEELVSLRKENAELNRENAALEAAHAKTVTFLADENDTLSERLQAACEERDEAKAELSKLQNVFCGAQVAIDALKAEVKDITLKLAFPLTETTETERLKTLVTRFLNQPLSDLIDDDLLDELTGERGNELR